MDHRETIEVETLDTLREVLTIWRNMNILADPADTEGFLRRVENYALHSLQHRVGTWGDQTFPRKDLPAAIQGAIHHAREELAELEASIQEGEPVSRIAEESADVVILMMAVAHMMRFSLLQSVEDKHAVNRAREWGPPDHNGIVRHVKDAEEPARRMLPFRSVSVPADHHSGRRARVIIEAENDGGATIHTHQYVDGDSGMPVQVAEEKFRIDRDAFDYLRQQIPKMEKS